MVYTKCINILVDILNKNHLKVTKAREEIYRILNTSNTPITVEGIAKRIGNKKIDVVTIYRTIETFLKCNIIKRVDLRGDSLYYEMVRSHHHHIVCTNCNDIEEIHVCGISELKPKSNKFSIVKEHSLEFFGICKKCIG